MFFSKIQNNLYTDAKYDWKTVVIQTFKENCFWSTPDQLITLHQKVSIQMSWCFSILKRMFQMHIFFSK